MCRMPAAAFPRILLAALFAASRAGGADAGADAAPPPTRQAQAQAPPEQTDEQRRRQQQQEQMQQEQRDLARQEQYKSLNMPAQFRIEGRVLMASGGAPPDRVPLTVVCAGNTHTTILTDAKGVFGTQLGDPLFSAPADASLGAVRQAPGPGTGSVDSPKFRDCELRANLQGFRAQPAPLHMLQTSTINYFKIVLHPIAGVTGHTFSATTAYAPEPARKAHQKGSEALRRNKLDEAERELRRATSLHPQFAVAWYDLGRTLRQRGQPAAAKAALLAAAQADPRYLNPYPVLAQIAFDERNWDDLARHTATVIELNPGFSPTIYVFSAQANLSLRRFDVAARHAREAITLDSERKYPVAHRLLGRILAESGQREAAAGALRLYLAAAPNASDAAVVADEIAVLSQPPR